jgi:hypothetical protein
MVKAVVVMPPSGALVRPKAKQTAVAGLALINQVLDANTVEAMVDADRFCREVQQAAHLGEGAIRPGFLDRAKPLHKLWLPNFARAESCSSALFQLVCMPPLVPLTQAAASQMLHYLFAAMGRRRGDEAAAKLLACADIFSPASNAIGTALGLWAAAPTHPAFLAIAIRQLMAAKVFEPSESELREALAAVERKLSTLAAVVDQWLARAERADEIVFEYDRRAWTAAYAAMNSKVALAMRDRLVEEPADNDQSPSTRWQALNALALPLPGPSREAACEVKPAKRTTRKPRRAADA